MSLTPDTAWLPYEPSAEQPWNRRRAAHLMRRAGFAATRDELDSAVKAGPAATVQSLLAGKQEQAAFSAEMATFARTLLAGNNPQSLSTWWLYRMLHTPAPLLEKLTLFWHGHFATSAAKVLDAQLMYQQNVVLREHALGSFAELVQQMARDPAMLIYLDSATNRKAHPNENFAREVMELFCLGLGNYSERDIQELSRCFTGWEIQRGQFKFNSYQHDSGEKRLFGQRGDFDGAAGLKLILAQPAAPQFICAKLVRFFVTDSELESAWLAPLARQFREHDLEIAPLVETILLSRYFHSEESIGQKIRSPVELAIGLLRSLDATASTQRLSVELGELGQLLFYPPNVKGWDGGLTWINSATLLGRANLVKHLIEDRNAKFGGGTLPQYVERLGWKTSAEVVDGLSELWLATDLTADVRTALIAQLDMPGRNRQRVLQQLIHTLGSLPEFQLS